MYRNFSQEEISTMLTIYPDEQESTVLTKKDLNIIEDFLSNATLPKLIDILTNKKVSKEVKMSVLMALNSPVKYSSIKNLINSKTILYNVLKDIDLTPKKSIQEVENIIPYIQGKSKTTSILTNAQRDDVESFFRAVKIPYILSTTGSNDYRWSNDEAGADGRLYPGTDKEILIYNRYGTSSGGAQNDRYRSMLSTAKKHPERKFLFIVDGVEALLQYGLINKGFKESTHDYKNALWSTVKFLSFIDFEKFEFKK